MRDRPFELARAIGTALVLSLAGCPGEIQTASPAAELELTDKLETPLAPASEYVLIPPRPLPPPSTWRFSADGQHLAAPLDEGCGVWELESGRHAGVFGAEVGEPTCERWPPVIRLFEARADEREGITADVATGCLTTHGAGIVRLRASDQTCRGYVGVALAPDGRRLAAARRDPLSIDVWDLELGDLVTSLAITQTGAGLELALVWGAGGIDALVLREWPSQGSRAKQLSLLNWPDIHQAPVTITTMIDPSGAAQGLASYVDPLHRWLWVHTIDRERGIEITRALDLRQPDQRAERAPSWREARAPPIVPRIRQWLAGTSTAWLEVRDERRADRVVEFEWTATIVGPEPKHEFGQLERGGEPLSEWAWELLAVSPDVGAIFAYRRCLDAEVIAELRDNGDDVTPRCEAFNAIPEGCEWMDANADVSVALLRCRERRSSTPRWALATLTNGPSIVPFFELGAELGEAPITWLWARDKLLIASGERGARVLDDSANEQFSFPHVRTLHRTKLDRELGLALVSDASKSMHVLDLDTGQDLALAERLAWNPTLAAFDPSGTHLALSDGVHVLVLALVDAATWAWAIPEDAGALVDFAWRQDGAVLFGGHTRAWPERAWDPRTGERLTSAEAVILAADLERFGVEGLDPSWRWATDGREFVRLLDGASLHLLGEYGAGGAVSSRGEYFIDSAYGGGTDLAGFALRRSSGAIGELFGIEEFGHPRAREELFHAFFTGR